MTQKEALACCKAMLARYRVGDTINEQDSQFLRNLLPRHPEAGQKIGCGLKRFFKAQTTQGTNCFWLEREDGSRTDFSYAKCARAKGMSLAQEFSEACRQSVKPELDAAKKAHFQRNGNADGKVRCEVTGELINVHESHLDHKAPLTFEVIVKTFIEAYNITISPDTLSTPGDAQFVTTFADEELRQRFVEYHNRVAVLRIVTPRRNMSLGGSGRLTKPKCPVVLPRAA